MNAVAKIAPAAEVTDPLAKLREPFPAHQISKLPKETKAQADQRKAEQTKGNWPPKCSVCQGYHHIKAVHLDYVGHAALTDRLLDVDPHWFWEPVAFGPDGTPAFDRNGGLWIKLTVCGMTRLGYGSADGKSGGDAVKEMIGDALRNAAMRFGAALDLWHKGDLHVDADEPASPAKPTQAEDNPPSDPIAGTTESRPARKTARQAKIDGDHERFLEKLHGFKTVEALDEWAADWDILTEQMPVSWIEPMNDKYLMHREALLAAQDGDFPAGLGDGGSNGVSGGNGHLEAAHA